MPQKSVSSANLNRVPEPHRAAIFEAVETWGATSFSIRKHLSGRSGAMAALVDIELPSIDEVENYSGVAVIKTGTSQDIKRELINYKSVIAISKDVCASVPSIIRKHETSVATTFLMTVAGWSLLEADPMLDLSGGKLSSTCQIVSEFLIDTLNVHRTFDERASRAYAVLLEWVGRQIGGESRIPQFLEENTDLPVGSHWFRYLGSDYPNPLRMADDDSCFHKVDLHCCRGFVHGDLHTGNVLLSRSSSSRTVYFIDFDTLKENACLFFDHAYLELKILLTERSEATPQRWKAICDRLFDTQEIDADGAAHSDDVGLLRTCQLLRLPLLKLIKKFQGRTEDIKNQIMLARIAAGINFCNKKDLGESGAKQSNKLKFFAFMYASSAAREFAVYNNIDIPVDAPPIRYNNEPSMPVRSDWRMAWEACHGFKEFDAAYVLLAGGDLDQADEFSIQTLARLPWSLVVDFSQESADSKLSTVGLPIARAERSVFHGYPHQIESAHASSASIWLMAESADAAKEQAGVSIAAWKAKTLKPLRQTIEAISRTKTPLPFVVLVAGVSATGPKVHSTLSAIQETVPSELALVWLADNLAEAATRNLSEEFGDFPMLACPLDQLMLGAYQVLGEGCDRNAIWVPTRGGDSQVRPERIPEAEFASYAALFELFPASPSNFGNMVANNDLDFLQGNTISWHSLDVHVDIPRDAAKGIEQFIRSRLNASPNESYAIEHTPGAGGTTLSRRIGWDFRDEFPVVSVSKYNQDVCEGLDALFQRCALPLLIIMEAGLVPATHRDQIYRDLKSRNVRFLILDVKRRVHPINAARTAALRDPMPLNEARRFHQVYMARAPKGNYTSLSNLVSERVEHRSHAEYRSPFFFGLYAFERNFVRVESFVSASVAGLSTQARELLCFLALVSRYSQERLPLPVANHLAGLLPSSPRSGLEGLLDQAGSTLIFSDGKMISIKHPLLAEMILKLFLQPEENASPDAWRGALADFSISAAQWVVSKDLHNNNQVMDIMYDLFLERQESQGQTKHIFSDLMHDFMSHHAERKVFESLCELFPANPYFVSHMARNLNYRKTGTFDEAILLAEQAIALAPDDGDHYHIIGMIYRFEIERRLQKLERPSDPNKAILAIDSLFDKAVDAFAHAAKLQPDGQYPLITPIQLSIYVLDALRSISGRQSFIELLNRGDAASAWCRKRLDYADNLFEALHHIEAASEPSERRIKCDADRNKLIGDIGRMLTQLRSLLGRPDATHGAIRRLIARWHLQRLSTEGNIEKNSLRETISLCEENLERDPGSISDLRNWLRAYRGAGDFSISVAIDRVARASLVSDHIDPLYYLMILHFMAYRAGIPSGLVEAKKFLAVTSKKATMLAAQKSFEWIASEKVNRALPLLHHSELGEWPKGAEFFAKADLLARITGRIDEIKSPQAGVILIDSMPAFFVPRSGFRKISDLNRPVSACIGFSYQGLRAWSVEPI